MQILEQWNQSQLKLICNSHKFLLPTKTEKQIYALNQNELVFYFAFVKMQKLIKSD